MDIEWGKLHSNDNYRVAHHRGKILGWVVLIDGVWVARISDGTVRAEFPTMQEAQDFLQLIVNAQGEPE